MSSIETKIIRVYPKKLKIEEIDCQKICNTLANTASELWEKVIYFENKIENCLDIKYKARKSGELGIEEEINKYDIWTITGVDGRDTLKKHAIQNKISTPQINSLYSFDHIRIIGNQEQLLKNLYPLFFNYGKNENQIPHFLAKAFEKVENNGILINQSGVYTAVNNYEIGTKYSNIAEKVSRADFLKLRGLYTFIDDFIFYQSPIVGLKNLIHAVLKEVKGDAFSNYGLEDLTAVQFIHRNRIVKELKWSYSSWNFSSSDWWDNLVNPEWKEYTGKIKTDENNA